MLSNFSVLYILLFDFAGAENKSRPAGLARCRRRRQVGLSRFLWPCLRYPESSFRSAATTSCMLRWLDKEKENY